MFGKNFYILMGLLFLVSCGEVPEDDSFDKSPLSKNLLKNQSNQKCPVSCKIGQITCGSNAEVLICKKQEVCNSWAIQQKCQNSMICRLGTCISPMTNGSCKNECNSLGSKRCNNNGVEICSSIGSCFKWTLQRKCVSPLSCQNNACACPQGSSPQNGNCKSMINLRKKPQNRSLHDVCSRYKSDYILNKASHNQGYGQCDPGSISRKVIDDALKITNFYRWMVGLKEVYDDATLNKGAQACSVIQAKNSSLSHSPPQNSYCWNQLGSKYSGESNLGKGYTSPSEAVEGYIEEINVPSLGHRRWIFSPYLGKTGIGFVENGKGTCQHVFDKSGSNSVEFIAWPNPGPFPSTLLRKGAWSIQNWIALKNSNNVDIKITRASDKRFIKPKVTILDSGYGYGDAISFMPDQSFIKSGENYLIQASSNGKTIQYTVNMTTCP